MDEPGSLSHTKWNCKYHVIFIPKFRRKALYEQLRKIWRRCSTDWLRRRRAASKKDT